MQIYTRRYVNVVYNQVSLPTLTCAEGVPQPLQDATKSNSQRFFVVFSAIAWNFKTKFYKHIHTIIISHFQDVSITGLPPSDFSVLKTSKQSHSKITSSKKSGTTLQLLSGSFLWILKVATLTTTQAFSRYENSFLVMSIGGWVRLSSAAIREVGEYLRF